MCSGTTETGSLSFSAELECEYTTPVAILYAVQFYGWLTRSLTHTQIAMGQLTSVAKCNLAWPLTEYESGSVGQVAYRNAGMDTRVGDSR